MTSTERVAHFLIEGSFITEHARGLLLSDAPGKAWRMIQTSLSGGNPGELQGVAIDVLKGLKKFTGDSSKGIRVAKDRSSAKYQKTLAFIYAGRVKIKNAWYRPYAEVVAFSPEDAISASLDLPDPNEDIGTAPEHMALIRKWWKNRARHYAHEGVICVEIPRDRKSDYDHRRCRFFLFEPVGEAPFWRDELLLPEDAIREYVAAGHKISAIGAMGSPDEEEDHRDYRGEREAREEAECEAEFQEEEDMKREIAYQAKLVQIREDVLKQANGNLFDLVTSDGRTFQVPLAPFENWALRRSHSLRHLAPEWKEVSVSGMKMQMDDPYHTDWLLGAGISFEEGSSFSRNPVMEAALAKMGEVQAKYGNFECTVLASAPECEGYVGESPGCIFVLKDLSNTPENNAAIEKARGIITENGGELSHLSIIAREMRIPIFRVKDAVKRYPRGMKLRLDSDRGYISHPSPYQDTGDDE